ncbi:MAG TPA: HlyD family secretion protein [Terriglobia bacterium]|nr:HlyD family secretion protein [Terriglobia bacterium]
MATTVSETNEDVKIPTPNGGTRNNKMSNPRLRKMILGSLIVVIAALAVALYQHYRYRVTTDDAQVDGHITPIASKIYGNVVEVMVEDNQKVKRGQVLVRLDPRDYQARVDQLRAALALAEGQSHAAQVGVPLTHETTQSGTSAAEAQLSAAEADYQQAKVAEEKASTSELAYARANVDARQAAYERAKADLARMKPLVDKAEISQQQYDAFLAAARVAESELKAAQEKAATASQEVETAHAKTLSSAAKVSQARATLAQSIAGQKQVTIRSAEATSAVAAVSQARANLAASELQLSYTTIVAPSDGVVTKKSVEVGQIVQMGQGLMVLIPLHDVWVTANFKETQLDHVHPGQQAEIEVDMYGKTFKGKVDSIAGATGARLSLLPPENATGNYVKVVQRIPVKIVLDPGVLDQEVLRPGMNVVATILTK